MTIKSSFGEVKLDVNPGTNASPVLDPETPFRVLLLGDFSGRRGARGKIVDRLEARSDRSRQFRRSAGAGTPRVWRHALRGAGRFSSGPDLSGQRAIPERCAKYVGSWRRLRLSPKPPPKSAAGARRRCRAPTAAVPKAAEAAEPERPELAPGINLLDSIVEAAEPAAPAGSDPARRTAILRGERGEAV